MMSIKICHVLYMKNKIVLKDLFYCTLTWFKEMYVVFRRKFIELLKRVPFHIFIIINLIIRICWITTAFWWIRKKWLFDAHYDVEVLWDWICDSVSCRSLKTSVITHESKSACFETPYHTNIYLHITVGDRA